MSYPISNDILAQHIAVLGKTGSGKSYAVRGAVEKLLDHKARVCVVDPTGAWYGLRSSASGARAGYPVVIFGGDHADLPLGSAHGDAIAEVVGTSSTPSILDTSAMKVSERTKFFADFADAIVRKNKGPLHLVIDEAHLFMPQARVNDPQSGAMMHAGNNMVSLGRSRGLRIILITQRPAKLHKDALTQAETLIAMKLIAPQDRAAVQAWIEDNADDKKEKEIISSLATLKTGQGWIWAPALNRLEKVSFPKIKTYDSGRAPDGSESKNAKVLAPIDLASIAKRLETVSAAAIADDPKRLKLKIAELERQLKYNAPTPVDTKAIEHKAHDIGRAYGMKMAGDVMQAALNAALAMEPETAEVASKFLKRLPSRPSRIAIVRNTHPAVKDTAIALRGGGKRRMMIALAQNQDGLTQAKLSILTGLAQGSGTWKTYLSELRTLDYIQGSDPLMITNSGLAALGPYERLPTGPALIEYWQRRLGSSGKRAIFDEVIEHYPAAVSPESVAQITNLAFGSGTWKTYLSELRTLGLIEGRGQLRASDSLFS